MALEVMEARISQQLTDFQNSRALRLLLTRIDREILGLDNLLLDPCHDPAATVRGGH